MQSAELSRCFFAQLKFITTAHWKTSKKPAGRQVVLDVEANLAVSCAHKWRSGITNIEFFCSLTRTFKNHYKHNVFCTKSDGVESENASTRRVWDVLVTSNDIYGHDALTKASKHTVVKPRNWNFQIWHELGQNGRSHWAYVYWCFLKFFQNDMNNWKNAYRKTSSWWEKEPISENGRKLVLMQDHLDLLTKAFCKSIKNVFTLMWLKRGWCSGLATSEEIHVLRLVTTEWFLWKWPTSFENMLTPNFDRFWLPHSDSIRKTPYR